VQQQSGQITQGVSDCIDVKALNKLVGVGPDRFDVDGVGPDRSDVVGVGPDRSDVDGVGPDRSDVDGVGPDTPDNNYNNSISKDL
jgi:hypothetical protein